jgi:prepilin-type N-terminal cleavage/methylation domain-containing protein
MKPDSRGFTLVEIIVVIAIMGVLLTIGTLYFGQMNRKSQIERQTREMYADLMGARSQALYQKQKRTVTITAGQYKISPWNQGGGSATVLQRSLSHSVTVSPAGNITFDERGMASGTVSICVQQNGNEGSVDSLLVYPTNIGIGKRNAGGACTSAQIALQ